MKPENYIAAVKGFPIEGIIFKDITPLLANGEAFAHVIDSMSVWAQSLQVDVVIAPEARGFIFGTPVAYALKVGFVPVRKPGKLPREEITVSYDLEYGSNELSVHADAILPGQRVLLVDDVLATGGTVAATRQLIAKLGGTVVGYAFALEIPELKGREHLCDAPVHVAMP